MHIKTTQDITSHLSEWLSSKRTQHVLARCGENGTLVHCWWNCKLVQPLLKAEQRFPKNLKIALPQFRSVQFSRSVMSDSATTRTAAREASLSITNCQSLHKLMSIESLWCHIIISSPVVHFSFHLQSFSASGSFQMSQLFASGGQSIGVSASASVLPMKTQDWSPLGWTGWISLQSKGLSRVFSNATDQKHQFFGVQLSLWSNSHIHTWPLEKP